MNIEKYTERARGFIQSAQSLAMRDGHQQFSPLHLLKVLLDDSEGLAMSISRLNWRTFDAAEKAAEKAGDSFVTVERLLLGLVSARLPEPGLSFRKRSVVSTARPTNRGAAPLIEMKHIRHQV